MESAAGTSNSKTYLSLNDTDRDGLLDKAIPKNTKDATKHWIKLLNDYLKSRKIANSVDEILEPDLPRTLELFYSEITKNVAAKKTKKGTKTANENTNENNNNDTVTPERYSNTSIRAMRAAIKRYTEDKRQIDIMTNENFSRANKVFDAILKDNKSKGKGIIQHKETIRSEDLERLQDYFSNT